MAEYINRQALLRYLNDIWLTATPNDFMPDDDRHIAMVRCMGLNDAIDAVKSIPAADAIEELTDRNVGKWIPVTERLPSENDRYLTVSIEPWFGTTVVDTMRWSGVWMYDGRQTESTVTHWMPLPSAPQPPKEET